MGSLKLTESQLEQLIESIVSEGALEDWNDDLDFESKMIQSMIKEKLREIQNLKEFWIFKSRVIILLAH
jgi:hypothetical protein